MTVKARTWVAVRFGGPEALRSVEADVPEPGPGHVTIDVRGVGMNPVRHVRLQSVDGENVRSWQSASWCLLGA
jgi:NADPH:quinone reductase-like Zn-dependent oxidoreductase